MGGRTVRIRCALVFAWAYFELAGLHKGGGFSLSVDDFTLGGLR